MINDELDAENTKFTEVDNVASSNKIVVSESKESLKTVPTPPFLTETYSKQKNSASTNVSMEDLSKPYGQYKCISPNFTGLQRQYSLDRGSEIRCKSVFK